MKIGDIIRSPVVNGDLKVKRIYDNFIVVEKISEPKIRYPIGLFYQLLIIRKSRILGSRKHDSITTS